MISIFHAWLGATDAAGATIRTALLDLVAFDLVDHHVLFATVCSKIDVKPAM